MRFLIRSVYTVYGRYFENLPNFDVKLFRAVLFANARRVYDSEFWVKNWAIFRLRPRKPFLRFFLEIKRLFEGANYIRFLIYLKAINEQKIKHIHLPTFAAQRSIFPESPS